MNKKQAQQGTLGDLQDIEYQIEELASKGIQVPDSVKLINDPALAQLELDKIRNEADQIDEATNTVADAADAAFQRHQQEMENMQNIETELNASKTYFNLKKAQLDDTFMDDDLNADAFGAEPVENESPMFDSVVDLVSFLDGSDEVSARTILFDVVPEEDQSSVAAILNDYYENINWETVDDPMTKKINLAMPIWKNMVSAAKAQEAKPGVVEDATFSEGGDIVAFVKDVEDQIKKMAYQNKGKPYNLNKEAQAKSVENMFMYGPEEKRYDPFLRQPISDWHIVERNKGYGFVVDDFWNIDWEAIWRGNIMDKYSRPYRDTKTGEWIGGYIHKRFEVDKWIPNENNYQLLPGQKRKEYDPSERSLEARMQSRRAEDADKHGWKPDQERPEAFNWKEASGRAVKKANFDQEAKNIARDIAFELPKDIKSDQQMQTIVFNRLKKIGKEHLFEEVCQEVRKELRRDELEYAYDRPGDPHFASSKKKKIKADLDQQRKLPGQSYFEGDSLPEIWVCPDGSEPDKETHTCPDGSLARFVGYRNKETGEPDDLKQIRDQIAPPEYVQQGVPLASRKNQREKWANLFRSIKEAQMPDIGGGGPGGLPAKHRKKRKHRTEEIKQMTDSNDEVKYFSDPLDDRDINDDNTDIEQSMNDLFFDS